jgi:hypothetical protein
VCGCNNSKHLGGFNNFNFFCCFNDKSSEGFVSILNNSSLVNVASGGLKLFQFSWEINVNAKNYPKRSSRRLSSKNSSTSLIFTCLRQEILFFFETRFFFIPDIFIFFFQTGTVLKRTQEKNAFHMSSTT